MSTRPVIGIPADRRIVEPHPHHMVGEKYLQALIDCAGLLPTLSSVDYGAGYSLERATLNDGQSAAVGALTTFGAGCCIACQRS